MVPAAFAPNCSEWDQFGAIRNWQPVRNEFNAPMVWPTEFACYSGKSIWPSTWNFPLTPGAPVSGWPPPMVMV